MVNSLPDQNFVFSPLSLHSALAIIYFGTTDGSITQTELWTALGGLLNEDKIKSGYKNLVKDYNGRKSILYGNHLWVADTFNMKESYERLIREKMNAQLSNADFKSDETVQDINGWVKNITKGNINSLVREISPDTQIFLANALYFKQNWLLPFEENDFYGNPLNQLCLDRDQ